MELEHVFNNLKIKSYIDQENNPWFKGKDIATILGYKNTKKSIRDHIDEDDKINLNILKKSHLLKGNDQETIYISESGVYSLIFKSKMKEAKVFKKWVISEVLPSIRKRGEYKLKQEENKKLSIEFQQKLSIMDSRISEIQQNAEKEFRIIEFKRFHLLNKYHGTRTCIQRFKN